MIFGRVMRVQGESMRPAYRPGDLVWIRPAGRAWTPAPGQVVAARPAALGRRAVLKRVACVDRGQVTLLGEHPDSCDSRRFGPVRRAELIGPAVRLWPWGARA